MRNWRWILLFSEQTYETLIKRILENTSANNLDIREGSVSFNLLAPLTEELAKAYIEMGNILNEVKGMSGSKGVKKKVVDELEKTYNVAINHLFNESFGRTH